MMETIEQEAEAPEAPAAIGMRCMVIHRGEESPICIPLGRFSQLEIVEVTMSNPALVQIVDKILEPLRIKEPIILEGDVKDLLLRVEEREQAARERDEAQKAQIASLESQIRQIDEMSRHQQQAALEHAKSLEAVLESTHAEHVTKLEQLAALAQSQLAEARSRKAVNSVRLD